jgi:glycosyltransferase involved in cell wall biosynthesis
MKVAVVTAFPGDPASPRGGVEAVAVNLVDGLLRLGGLDVHVVTMDRAGLSPSVNDWRGATVHRLPHAGGSTLWGAIGPGRRQMSKYLTALAPDVVHAHDTYGLMVKGLAIPRVFTIHGFIHEDTRVSTGRWAWARAAIWQRVETSGWADQPHIIAISPYVRERLRGIATGLIHDIDNPVDRSFFSLARRDAGNVIFTAGAVCQRKNTLGLVNAFAHLIQSGIDARLRLAGHVAEPEYAERVNARIRSAGLHDRVTMLGAIGTKEVARELESASVFALVSLEENSPLGVQEAMAAGVPVVTSGRCGMPYLVRDGESGFLVDPLDAADAAARFAELLTNSDLRRTQGDRAAEIARQRFHPDEVARRTREVYVRAVAKRGAAAATSAL